MVFYRKYRPQKISELDLTSVREKLTSVLTSQNLPHAFLFTGSKGLGKTSSARILAKAINCESVKRIASSEKNKEKTLNPSSLTLNATFEPCNKCDSCKSITNGSNIDVLEIDAASNGGVEEIRTLRERVKFAPSTLNYKVYIIDEVHMLSTGAFNALLKTLEEPPSHVIFILATTEIHKLPETVISRTFQVNFEKPDSLQIVNSLKRIVDGEKLKVDDKVLSEISKISDNSFRDAAKNLEELAIFANGKKITQELFDKVFKTGSVKDGVLELLRAFDARDAKKALKIISDFSNSGVDFKVVIERLVDHLRGLLMLRNGIESDEVDVKGLDLKNINELLKLSNEAYAEMKVSIVPSLPLELLTVKYCILDAKKELGDGSLGIEKGNQKPEVRSRESGVRSLEQENKVLEVKSFESEITLNQNSKDVLKELILEVNRINKPAAALLRSCKSADLINSKILITTPFPIHADRLKSEKVLPDLRKVSNELFKTSEIEIKVVQN